MKNRKKLSANDRAPLAAITADQLDDLWEDALDYGIWVRTVDLPYVDPSKLADSELIEDETRCDELRNGGEPTEAEQELFHEWWVESQLDGDEDADDIPGYALATVKDHNGNEGVALILRTGYSFSGINTWLEGFFGSREEAIQHMKNDGWCS